MKKIALTFFLVLTTGEFIIAAAYHQEIFDTYFRVCHAILEYEHK